MTEPSGHRLPRGKADGAGQAAAAGFGRRNDHVVRIDAVALAAAARATACRRSDFSHHSSTSPSVLAGDGQHVEVEQAQLAQVQHDLRHAAGQEDAHRRMVHRPVGQHRDEPRHAAIDLAPVVDRRPRQPGGEGDRRNVQQQVRRAAERRVDDHRVANRWRR